MTAIRWSDHLKKLVSTWGLARRGNGDDGQRLGWGGDGRPEERLAKKKGGETDLQLKKARAPPPRRRCGRLRPWQTGQPWLQEDPSETVLLFLNGYERNREAPAGTFVN